MMQKQRGKRNGVDCLFYTINRAIIEEWAAASPSFLRRGKAAQTGSSVNIEHLL